MYAVVALGYTMVYGIVQLINFAHGEVVMIGCMVAFSVFVALAGSGLPPLAVLGLGILAAVPVCMAVGYTVERVAYRPLRSAPRLAPLITAIGVSIVLQQLAMIATWRLEIEALDSELPKWKSLSSMICGKAMMLRLQTRSARCCSTIDTPIAVMSGARRGALLSGR